MEAVHIVEYSSATDKVTWLLAFPQRNVVMWALSATLIQSPGTGIRVSLVEGRGKIPHEWNRMSKGLEAGGNEHLIMWINLEHIHLSERQPPSLPLHRQVSGISRPTDIQELW